MERIQKAIRKILNESNFGWPEDEENQVAPEANAHAAFTDLFMNMTAVERNSLTYDFDDLVVECSSLGTSCNPR